MSGRKPGVNKIIRDFVKHLFDPIDRLDAEIVEAEQRGYAKAMEAERKDADQRIREAVKAERERCARIAEEAWHWPDNEASPDSMVAAIRKGGDA